MKPFLSTAFFYRRAALRRGFAVSAMLLAMTTMAGAQDAPDTMSAGPLSGTSVRQTQPKAEDVPDSAARETAVPVADLPPVPVYDKTIFRPTLPSGELGFLKQFDGIRTKDLYHDKQFKAVKKATLPGWMFHFGRDMSVGDAMDAALGDSKDAVTVRDGRYAMLSGVSELYPGLQGRGFLWVDMQDGLTVGGFYFRPTNGEPTPTITVFSKQISADALSMDQLPPEFFKDYVQWSADERIAPVTTRYFIGAENRRILLEHDEDFCASNVGPMGSDCLQMTADAADTDMNTAYYLDQVHYATNATAYMLVGGDETAFLAYRDRQCGGVADPIGCRVRVTRTQIHRVGGSAPVRR